MRGESIIAIVLLLAALFALLIMESGTGGRLVAAFGGNQSLGGAGQVATPAQDAMAAAYWQGLGDFNGVIAPEYEARPWMPVDFRSL
jgi:hypothetical protein